MALKKSLTDPLNWLLLLLAAAFVYYIFAVPYFTELYLKTPQEMSFTEYLRNPSHPRPFMLHALSQPPSSIEVVIHDLEVVHIDQDSILLEDRGPVLPPDAEGARDTADTSNETVGTDPAATTADDESNTAGGDDTAAADPAAASDDQAADAGASPVMQTEAPPPGNQLIILGDNLDLLPVSVGQRISIRTHGLYESPLGWMPKDPELDRNDEELFTKEELDALEFLRIVLDSNTIEVPYVKTGELRFAAGDHVAGEPMVLDDIANDTRYIQTVSRLSGGSVDIGGVRLVDKLFIERAPYFLVQDDQGQKAHVFFNSRLLHEWYWAMDRLGGQEIVVRGTLRSFTPSALRALSSDDNVQAVLDGYALLSPDGSVVINLENPLGGIGGSR